MTSEPIQSRQPSFTMPWQERQSRTTTFFRAITVIPSIVWLSLWGSLMIVSLPIAWFALLFTGRYPKSLYDFHASYARYTTYAYGYLLLATDKWPGFSGSADADQPVRLGIDPPLPVYSRVKVLFRFVLMIPVVLIVYAMQIVATVAAFVAWFAIVFTGKLPQGVYQMIHLGLSYQQRAMPYMMLLTEDWPAFTVEGDRAALEPAPPTHTSYPTAPAGSAEPAQIADGPTPVPAPTPSSAPPNLGDFRPPVPPDEAA